MTEVLKTNLVHDSRWLAADIHYHRHWHNFLLCILAISTSICVALQESDSVLTSLSFQKIDRSHIKTPSMVRNDRFSTFLIFRRLRPFPPPLSPFAFGSQDTTSQLHPVSRTHRVHHCHLHALPLLRGNFAKQDRRHLRYTQRSCFVNNGLLTVRPLASATDIDVHHSDCVLQYASEAQHLML